GPRRRPHRRRRRRAARPPPRGTRRHRRTLRGCRGRGRSASMTGASAMSPSGGARGWLLVLDTATNTIVVAAGRPDGSLLAANAFGGRYRHSQELLPAVQRLLAGANLQLRDLAGVIVGTGPGALTGLRVGIATAKTLAHELRVPVVGIATSEALLAAADGAARLWLPSGPRDRLRLEPGRAPEVVHEGAGGAVGELDGDA